LGDQDVKGKRATDVKSAAVHYKILQQMGLKIKDGKFYRDGKHEATQFGNTEQITALRQLEHDIQAFKGGKILDVEYEVNITAKIDFECICGYTVYLKREGLTKESYNKFIGQECDCQLCKRKYVLEESDEKYLIVKTA